MTALIDALGQLVINNYGWRHLIIAAGILVQGEITVFIAILLILNNYLGWGGFFVAVLSALIVYEGFLFLLGKKLRNTTLGKRWAEKIMKNEKTKQYLRHHLNHFLIIAKFLVYVNVGAIVFSGLTNMSLKSFLRNRLVANGLWFGAIAIGSYLILSGLTLLKLHQIEIGVAVFLIFLIIANVLLRRHLKKDVKEFADLSS